MSLHGEEPLREEAPSQTGCSPDVEGMEDETEELVREVVLALALMLIEDGVRELRDRGATMPEAVA